METLEQSQEPNTAEESSPDPQLPSLRSTLLESVDALKEHNAPSNVLEELREIFEAQSEDSPALVQQCLELTQAFDLNTFELKVVLLCLARELIPVSANLFAAYHGTAHQDQPSFRFCQALLTEADQAACTPNAPLRLWNLIEVDKSSTLFDSSLRIDERILHFLSGLKTFDARLAPYFESLNFARPPLNSALPYSQQILQAWQQAGGFFQFPLCRLLSSEPEPCLEIVNTLCQQTGLQAYTLKASALPAEAYEREAIGRLWQREALLGKCILFVDTTAASTIGRQDKEWIQHLLGPLVLATNSSDAIPFARPFIAIELSIPDSQSRFACAQQHLAQYGLEADNAVERTCDYFQLSEAAIGRAVSRTITLTQTTPPSVPLAQNLHEACKIESRHGLGNLTQRVTTSRNWSHLVLPDKQTELLHQIARQAKHRLQVYKDWGFGTQNANGLGITALLSGPSGTGKTLAAEVIAHELNLDLFRIDLSAVVSKYIGETEENLRKVFDSADQGGAVLLFDEADSLFGSRSEAKDSHDRHANIEVSYLLQRMETYRGIALLTTNFKQAIDSAFLRRLRFIVDFPYPEASLRLRLWQSAFPPEAPLGDINYEALAKLSLSGGNIRNIVLNAAFHAADVGHSVGMLDLQQAVRHELSKLERPIPESEIKALLK